jgi:hypothetical protein
MGHPCVFSYCAKNQSYAVSRFSNWFSVCVSSVLCVSDEYLNVCMHIVYHVGRVVQWTCSVARVTLTHKTRIRIPVCPLFFDE